MMLVMEEGVRGQGVQMVILDRPNFLATMQGPMLEPEFKSLMVVRCRWSWLHWEKPR